MPETKLPPLTEAQFTRQVIQLATLRGWRTAHFRPGRTAKGWRTAVQGDGAGFPDLLLLRDRRMIAAELKVSRRSLTSDQKDWLADFADAGAETYCWRPEDWPTIERVLA